jgi:hypothetical protein
MIRSPGERTDAGHPVSPDNAAACLAMASPCSELSGLDLYRSDHYDMWHNVAIPIGIVNLFLKWAL